VRKAFAAALLILVALAVAPLVQAGHVPTSPSITGAVYTTVDTHHANYTLECHNGNPAVNCNQYTAKQFVYLNGGPTKNQLSPDGVYFYAVLAPSGQADPNDGSTPNLSSPYDCYKNREIQITGGEVSAIYSSTDPTCFHNTAEQPVGTPHLLDPPFVQLYPYVDTPNPGGVYIMAVCYVGPTGTTTLPAPVTPSSCKYDAFKVLVDPTPPTCKLITTTTGPPKSITVAVQDSGAGLEDVSYTSTNVVNPLTFPTPLVVGQTDPFWITAVKADQTKGSTLSLTITDVAGNQTVCDPLLPGSRLVRLTGSATKVVVGVSASQTSLRVRNGARATAQVVIRVNGHVLRLRNLKPFEVRNHPIDRSWLLPGAANKVIISRVAGRGAVVVTIR
jgi:hypothetical protein